MSLQMNVCLARSIQNQPITDLCQLRVCSVGVARGVSVVQGAVRICLSDPRYLGSSSIHERVGKFSKVSHVVQTSRVGLGYVEWV
ncbi:hypothetical protein Hanom_Chr15g01385561 [Helianthus anomalus]